MICDDNQVHLAVSKWAIRRLMRYHVLDLSHEKCEGLADHVI
jgi:hypothetical protein